MSKWYCIKNVVMCKTEKEKYAQIIDVVFCFKLNKTKRLIIVLTNGYF